MKIKVNQDKCIACGLCVSMCPKVFEIDSSGKCKVISQDDVSCAEKASKNCPVDAINID
jgi:ferredoxin